MKTAASETANNAYNAMRNASNVNEMKNLEILPKAKEELHKSTPEKDDKNYHKHTERRGVKKTGKSQKIQE